MKTQMSNNILNMKVSVRALSQKRTTEKRVTFKPLKNQKYIIFVFFLFAIFHFGRRKFKGHPMVEYEVNPNPKVLTAFKQRPKFRISLVKTSNIIAKIFFHVLT